MGLKELWRQWRKLKMDKFMKQWLAMGVFLCLFCILQMFFAPANRFTIVMSYFTNMILFIALMYSTFLHYKNGKVHVFDTMKEAHERWEKLMKDFPHRCTWQCDICHAERIDALIGVAKYQDETKTMQINIKYCKDNSVCLHKAHSLDMWYGQKVYGYV